MGIRDDDAIYLIANIVVDPHNFKVMVLLHLVKSELLPTIRSKN